MAEKADLQARAKELGLDDSGTIPELKARIAEQEAAVIPQTDEQRDAANAAKDAADAAEQPDADPDEAARVRAEFDEAREAEVQAAAAEKAAKAKAEKERVDAEKIADLRADRGFTETSSGKLKAPKIGDDTSPKDAELTAKQASIDASGGIGRDLITDVAPGKSLADVVERNEAKARGEFIGLDEDTHPLGVQYFVVTEELDLIEVARKLGLHDHAELGAVNGRHSGIYGVQRGQRVVLPAHYRFDGIDGVITEGDEDELAGSEPTA
jgi:hypothetical protein